MSPPGQPWRGAWVAWAPGGSTPGQSPGCYYFNSYQINQFKRYSPK